MKKKRTEYNLTPEKVLEVWQTSHSAQEAADKLGMPKPILHARISKYRKMGVEGIKKMPRPRRASLDVDGMSEFVKRLG